MAQTESEIYQYCPRCASSAKVERGALRCPSCGLDMYIAQKTGACVVLIDEEGKLCVTRRARDPYKGMLDVVGGFIDLHETLEECACREVHEETGLTIAPADLHFIGSESHAYIRKEVTHFVVAAYFSVYITNIQKEAMIPKDDVASFEWYLPEELPQADFYTPEVYSMCLTARLQS